MPRYKYCIVPDCLNTATKNPDIVFFDVPRNKEDRKRWCKAMKRDSVKNPPLAEKSVRHVCQDHFDIETDTDNFMQYSLQGVKLRLKKGILPHKFDCQNTEKAAPVSKRAAKRQARQATALPVASTVNHPPLSPENSIQRNCSLENVSEDASIPVHSQSCSDAAAQADVTAVETVTYQDKATDIAVETVMHEDKATSTDISTQDFGCTAKPETREVACGTSSESFMFWGDNFSYDSEIMRWISAQGLSIVIPQTMSLFSQIYGEK